MKTRLTKLLVSLAMLMTPLMLQCAAENPQALMIMEATAMTQQTQCQLRADAPAQFIRPYGVLDLSLTNQYYLFPTVKNMMVELQTVIGEGPDSLITENHVLSIKAAEIRVDMGEFQPVSSDTNKVKQIATQYMFDGVRMVVPGSIEPGQITTLGLQVVRPELGNILQSKMENLVKKSGVKYPAVWIHAYVSVEAEAQNRTRVVSNTFAFPIMLCWGCLVQPFFSDTATQLPCYIGQDESIPCAMCQHHARFPEDCPVCYTGEEPRP